jgi:hypothetical protein
VSSSRFYDLDLEIKSLSSDCFIENMERFLGLRRKRRLEDMQHSIDARQIELVGIECTAHPRKHFGVFAMSGVSNRLQKISIAPHPANIFRRTGALTVQT